jgi:hypothetical protein
MYNTIPSDETIDKVCRALTANGMEAFVVENSEKAKLKVCEILPQGAEVMNMTSKTLDTIGVASLILNSGMYQPVRLKLTEELLTQSEKQKLGAGPDWAIGSVNAVTEEGQLINASATGSQLPAYASGAQNVIFVIGAQKIVKDVQEGMKRVYEYVLPLENERAKKAYGRESFVSKVLITNREVKPNRIRVILVRESLGF